jgi:hypothetical protein
MQELANIALDDGVWQNGASGWRAPFLPEFIGGWGDFVPLDSVLGDMGLGTMPGRTWVIAPDKISLERRWNSLLEEETPSKRAELFHPHPSGDRTITKGITKGLGEHHGQLESIEYGISNDETKEADEQLKEAIIKARSLIDPIRYGFRSFDRQRIIPDSRLINRPGPRIWKTESNEQVILTAISKTSPKQGPAITLTALPPDLDHYNGKGGRAFPLWKDAEATQTNANPAVLSALAKAFGAAPDPVDVFAYVAAVLAHPAFTETFRDDLIRPGLRVPLTADTKLFAEAAALGRRVIWLHAFGERFADLEADPPRPASQPLLPKDRRPFIAKDGAIPSTPEGFPDTMSYDAADKRLHIGTGFIDNVPPGAWNYEVSGKSVLTQWFSYRKKDRSRPIIGDRRKPSPLGDIQPDHWLPEYTSELLNVINVLALLVEMEPAQADLLKRIVDGPLIPASKIEGANE